MYADLQRSTWKLRCQMLQQRRAHPSRLELSAASFFIVTATTRIFMAKYYNEHDYDVVIGALFNGQ